VANLAFRFMGDRDLALDVLQETFLYVLKKFPGFRLTCQFRSFLYPAVRNLSIAARRKAERLQFGDDGALEQIAAPPSCDEGDSSRAQLTVVLTGLPEPQREVLLLRFVDGLSLDEIAAALEVPTGTIKSRLHNALAALRKDGRTKNLFME
jgi:RNA polymerase sigma-70 factor (ECF subfamily)